ncbi:MAG TPA: hypothetical protein V6D06_18155 [Trichocoleus sp.]
MRQDFTRNNRQQIISELRHQLRYASFHERDSIRRELNFWINNR